ncbi:hypothetical protein MJO28_003613 [Puccinia striiformis f. sp. tritici]|uniref:Uncharacterized protein n=1 Tax=Puccinia striiformis f. sp. tritici TaxID=168172 RepID=A0ACC0ENB0_9BASI|nr:uncharacterized protein Pst134EA_033002 [Puccinia striiformis f. sp. tritici]XP_047809980.1 hypothetical protein Pst134EA_007777 [Puccinia striiformis f. sp. tritici]KAH9440824.1 hypothetical protein Pst134EA_033002 [Puccinia striiformis f. sp. tritici]KAH9470526.1 hypothetical protein Pst134EA_007777 [Puccinia striiformis f. sp. tritici]KAI7956518.1 hypothetical protein MJO28_003613 [Puccinia striiformis f. sp. tritici]
MLNAFNELSLNSSGINEYDRQQGDLVVRGFRELVTKYDPDQEAFHERRAKGQGLCFGELAFKKNLLKRLHSSIIPLLRPEIIRLSRSLDPSFLQNKPGWTLRLILTIQTTIGQILSRIEDAIFELRSVIPSPPYRINDQHLRELKYFRTHGLDNCFSELLREYVKFFGEIIKLIQLSNLTTEGLHVESEIEPTRKRIIDYTSSSLNAVETMTRWYKDSEFDLVQLLWPVHKLNIDIQLKKVLHLINPSSITYAEDTTFPGGTHHPLSQSAISLAKLFIPIIKLSRLLFKKLSQNGMNLKSLPIFTEMRSDQLEQLVELPPQINQIIRDFIGVLRSTTLANNRNDQHPLRTRFTKLVNKLHLRVDPALFLVPFYLVPLIPDTTHRVGIRNHYQNWLVTWYTQFCLAVQNLLHTISSYTQP